MELRHKKSRQVQLGLVQPTTDRNEEPVRGYDVTS